MGYLLRVVLPDRPGSLGAVATALGEVGADIVSLDVVERGPGGAVDDLVCELPPGGLADTLVTACHRVPGVVVESLRRYQSGRDIHRDLELVDALAAAASDPLQILTEQAPGVFRAGWALLVAAPGHDPAEVLHGSAGAPDARSLTFPWLPLPEARRMDPRETWIPARWDGLGMELAAAPVGGPGCAVLLGRPGGPRFRTSEVLRLAHLAGIAATVGGG